MDMTTLALRNINAGRAGNSPGLPFTINGNITMCLYQRGISGTKLIDYIQEGNPSNLEQCMSTVNMIQNGDLFCIDRRPAHIQ